MKKLLSLVLSLALALSLTVPALAAETPAPGWEEMGYASLEACLEDSVQTESEYYAWFATPAEQKPWADAWLAAHPNGADGFDADAYFAAEYQDYADKAEYMQQWELTTDEELYYDLLCAWIVDMQYVNEARAQWAALCAAEPESTAAFLAAGPEEWFGYGDDSTIEELMANYGFTAPEQLYMEFYPMWAENLAFARERKALSDARVSALGGTPGQVNVLVNGRCLPFGAQGPKLADGVLLVPAAALQGAMGVVVKGDAEGYAPLRATAEAAGWDVLWDEEYETAVLLNRAAITAQYDKEFTQLNAALARLLELDLREAGQSYRQDASLALDLTAFDSLDGDKTYTAKLSMASLWRDDAFSTTITLDLSSLLSALTPEMLKDLAGSGLLDGGLTLQKLQSFVKSCTVELIYEPQTSTLYCKAPLLAQLSGGTVPEAGGWLCADLSYYDAEMPETLSIPMGEIVYSAAVDELRYGYGYSGTPIDAFDHLSKTLSTYSSLLGNGRFTERDGTLTYTLDAKTVNAALRPVMDDGYGYGYGYGGDSDFFRDFSAKLSLSSSGRFSASVDLRTDFSQLGYYYSLLGIGDFRLGFDASGTSLDYTMGYDLHWQNRFALSLDLSAKMEKTASQPLSAPPAGETITDLDTLSALFYTARYGE